MGLSRIVWCCTHRAPQKISLLSGYAKHSPPRSPTSCNSSWSGWSPVWQPNENCVQARHTFSWRVRFFLIIIIIVIHTLGRLISQWTLHTLQQYLTYPIGYNPSVLMSDISAWCMEVPYCIHNKHVIKRYAEVCHQQTQINTEWLRQTPIKNAP